jgi:methyltransferase
MAAVALAMLVFGTMLVEARRAARNERAQRARGGIEPAGDVYAFMQLAYPASFAAMLLEGVSHDAAPWRAAVLLGLALFVAAKALKWWAIATLGPYWTFRVIVVPGTAPVRTGPYRFLSHPNYVGVAGELMAVALMTGARVTGPLAVIIFGALMLRRVVIENRALDAILRRS